MIGWVHSEERFDPIKGQMINVIKQLPISTGSLKISLFLHVQPINLLVSKGALVPKDMEF